LSGFDPEEYEALPKTSHPTEPQLPLEARTILAVAQVKSIEERARQEGGSEPPDEWWKYVAGFFGLPVVADAEMLHRPPWVTWAVAAFLCLVGVITFFHVEYWTRTFGLIPAQAGRYGGLTLLTYSSLHAGLIHLAVNVYFLLIFGDNVEDTLGVGRYLLLLFFAAVASGVVHVVGDPRPAMPLVGASGAISGIVAFYALQFPRVRLQFMFRILLLGVFRWFQVPVYIFFILWVLAQFVGAWEQLAGYSSVSALGHLGGAAVGVLFHLEKRFVADDGSREGL
jgi:membrane associated rhomboid family serine protease